MFRVTFQPRCSAVSSSASCPKSNRRLLFSTSSCRSGLRPIPNPTGHGHLVELIPLTAPLRFPALITVISHDVGNVLVVPPAVGVIGHELVIESALRIDVHVAAALEVALPGLSFRAKVTNGVFDGAV